MPAMLHQLEPVPGIEQGGKLHVAGPNIMKGYFLAANPGILVPPMSIYGSGWYDTGDIVNVDDEGYIFIQGRSKRFAKIGGEMVSLAAVEQLAMHAWPDAQHAVVSLPDSKKGEQLVMLSTQNNACAKDLAHAAHGVAAIYLPRKVFVVAALPILGAGKIDYSGCSKLAAELLAADTNTD